MDQDNNNVTPNSPTQTPIPVTSDPVSKGSLISGLVLAAVGVGLSTQTLLHHIAVRASGSTNAVCNINATINCDKVALSPWAEIFTVPLGVWGIGYFVAAALLLAIGASHMKSAKEHMQSYVAMIIIGIVCSVVLGSVAAFVIGAVCLYCLGIYATTIVLGIHLWVIRKQIPHDATITNLVNGGATAVIVVALCALGWTLLKPSPAVLENVSASMAPGAEQPKIDIPVDRSPYSGRGEDYRLGPNEAPVSVVEFADFQCPPCRMMSELVQQLHAEFPGEVQIIFKNYPLDKRCSSTGGGIHEYACEAAAVGRCMGAAGKFWDYYKHVYDNQDAITTKTLHAWAIKMGASAGELDSCVKSPDTMAKIKDDVAVGDKVGVNATPTVFINGRRYTGGLAYPTLRGAVIRAQERGDK